MIHNGPRSRNGAAHASSSKFPQLKATYPPWQSVYGLLRPPGNDGIFDQLTGLSHGKVRQAAGRESEPSACLIDSQSVKTSTPVHLNDQGVDAARKSTGRKPHIVTDTLGLLLAVLVTAASVHDSTGGKTLLSQIATTPRRVKAWADADYKNAAINLMTRLLAKEATLTRHGT